MFIKVPQSILIGEEEVVVHCHEVHKTLMENIRNSRNVTISIPKNKDRKILAYTYHAALTMSKMNIVE